MQPERGPRLEKVKHQAAEQRLRRAILEGRDYPGKTEDLELVQRKQRELGPERLKRVAGEGVSYEPVFRHNRRR